MKFIEGNKIKESNVFVIIIILLLVFDCVYSFHLFAFDNFDGDIANIVVPSKPYGKVLENPFGQAAFFNDESYPATNRYFNHILPYYYFRYVPQFIQVFVSNPVESAFLSMHILKFATYIIVVISLFIYVRLFTLNEEKQSCYWILITIVPFVFSFYNYEYAAILDNSISYTIAYPLFFSFMLFFMYPWMFYLVRKRNILNKYFMLLWFLIIIILCLSGPLIAPCLLLFSGFYILYLFYKYEGSAIQVVKDPYLALAIFTLFFSIYSLYLGKFNSENVATDLSLLDRYEKAVEGFFKYFSFSEGVLIFLVFSVVNFSVFYSIKERLSEKTKAIWLISLGFIMVYFCLLPLGGFRFYRPFVIRRDTALPVTFILIFLISYSANNVLVSLSKTKSKILYKIFIVFVALYFISLDDIPSDRNDCQKFTLNHIHNSNEQCVKIENGCHILDWNVKPTCEESYIQSKLLNIWGVTKNEDVRFYQQSQ